MAAAEISHPSTVSLYVQTASNGATIGSATGFVVEHSTGNYLVTNWHVVAGRHPVTGEYSHATAIPETLFIWHHVANKPGAWTAIPEPLLDVDGPLWLEHPIYGRKVDVVALKLPATENVDLRTYPVPKPDVVLPSPSTPVSIVGFPFGLSAGGLFGIWVQGTVASEPSILYNGLPCFLIDSRTRSGQSGSPVIQHFEPGAVPVPGGFSFPTSPTTRLVGVYSGRISAESDLGFVWHASMIDEIITGGQRGTA